jgi:phosphatidate phosphatase APP1
MPNVIEAAIAAETSKVSREIMEPNAAWQSRTEQNMRRTAEVTSESVIALSITGDTQMFIDLETPTLNRTGLSPSYARIHDATPHVPSEPIRVALQFEALGR